MDTLRLASSRWSTESASKDDNFNGQALILRGKRQALLASNIANADTPRYRAVDFDFKAALEQALDSQSVPASPNEGGLSAPALRLSTASFVQYRQPAQSNLDGNSVDMDLERAEFARNAILYQFAITVLDDEVKEFKLASSDPKR